MTKREAPGPPCSCPSCPCPLPACVWPFPFHLQPHTNARCVPPSPPPGSLLAPQSGSSSFPGTRASQLPPVAPAPGTCPLGLLRHPGTGDKPPLGQLQTQLTSHARWWGPRLRVEVFRFFSRNLIMEATRRLAEVRATSANTGQRHGKAGTWPQTVSLPGAPSPCGLGAL